MIEFDGYIFGAAEKRFWARSRNLAQNVLLFAVLVLLPMVFRFAERVGSWVWIAGYCSLFLIIPLLLRIPKSEKEKRTLLPKKIYVEDEYIVCVGETYEESKLIDEVAKVIDHGEFYELVFPFGKVSDKFICQKCLLAKGTLEEFEQLFSGKITRKQTRGRSSAHTVFMSF